MDEADKTAKQPGVRLESGTPQAPTPDTKLPGDENPPATSGERSQIASLKDAFDLFGKLVFGLLGLCYVLGVVVVAVHLRQYGVNSLDLPQLHYITAGVWVVLPIAFVALVAIFGAFMAASQVEELRSRNWSDVLGLLVGGLGIIGFVINFFWGTTGIDFSWTGVVWVPLLGIMASVFILAGALSLRGISRSSARTDILLFLGVLVVGIGLFAAYVVLFARYTYQSIPWATGGGRASTVRLYLIPESRPYLTGLKISLLPGEANAPANTESLKLLLTTEKQYVIINSEGRAVSLPSEMVKGVTYEK